MKKLLTLTGIFLFSVGVLLAAQSYSPKSKVVRNNRCPRHYVKKRVGRRVRCYQRCRPGYRFKVKGRYTRSGGVVSYASCVR